MFSADTVNGFSFHPFLPMAVTSSGHRRFGLPDDTEDVTLSSMSSHPITVVSPSVLG